MTPEVDSSQLVQELLGSESFALIRRQGADHVDVLVGPVREVVKLADIPLEAPEVLAMVPFRQVQERGFEAREDNLPILCLEAEQRSTISPTVLAEALPGELPDLEDLGFDLSDEDYAQVVSEVIEQEIGNGEGANFVIRRDYRARLQGHRVQAALAWFRRLLERESGAYWTFAFVSPQQIAVGASPERHVSSDGSLVRMNPISGTLRHGGKTPDVETLLRFLADRKESDELVMVVDEELKMMSVACPEGGVMRGPYLKPMSKLTHTEYLLEGQSRLDPREILRLTMFAPTVIGSPMGSACSVIARREQTPRGYYSGVLARFTKAENGYTLDAPILIRTAFLDTDGNVQVSAGATLVRNSDPVSEAAETRTKTSGMLTALGLLDQDAPVTVRENPAVRDPQVLAALADRNRNLAPFWRDEQHPSAGSENAGIKGNALVVDFGDDFAAMLAHQLRHMGLDVKVASWADVTDIEGPDLVVFGPGPGDPKSESDERIVRLRQLLTQRVEVNLPLLAVCLAHQVLADQAGLQLVQLPEPRQGTPLQVRISGEDALIGYYNSYTALATDGSQTPRWDLSVHAEEGTDFVHALTGEGVASLQGHPESVLSYDGFATLRNLVQTVL